MIIIFAIPLLLISAPETTHATPLSQAEDSQIYTVESGDWLSKLADRFYDDLLAWPTIWKATNEKSAKDSRFSIIATC
jgi:nucleoid-associated protein YgaU